MAGSSEEEVAAGALAPWVEHGAVAVRLPDGERWAAMVGDRDLAIALPERNGDGTWVVSGVLFCAEPSTGPASIDGVLDCAGILTWTMQPGYAPDVPGVASPEEALEQALAGRGALLGGELVPIDATTASIVVDGREVAVARVGEVPAGGWAANVVRGCGDPPDGGR